MLNYFRLSVKSIISAVSVSTICAFLALSQVLAYPKFGEYWEQQMTRLAMALQLGFVVLALKSALDKKVLLRQMY